MPREKRRGSREFFVEVTVNMMGAGAEEAPAEAPAAEEAPATEA